MFNKESWRPVDSTKNCLQYNTAGYPYESLPCLYPKSIGWSYFPIEINFDPVPNRDWMMANPWVPILACTLYAVFIVLGRKYFASRPAWNWRNTMTLWNASLSLFSAMGFIRVFPHVLHHARHYTWLENMCFDPESHYGSGTTGLWVQLFVLSKIPELFDTFFIVIHKKPLIFLHWYHHISVLLYCWHSYVYKAPAGLYFCAMNYAVHALMYAYYGLVAARCKPKWLQPYWITLAQISQMVVGVGLTITGCYISWVLKPKNCYLTSENNTAALIMYGSYLFLFVEFFLQRYFTKSSKKTGASATTNGAVQNGHKSNGVHTNGHSKKEE